MFVSVIVGMRDRPPIRLAVNLDTEFGFTVRSLYRRD